MLEVLNEIGLSHRLVVDPLTPSAHGTLTDYREEFERDQIGEWVARSGADFVSFITADREQEYSIPGSRGFHVIRDPRDIIVSAYFSHRNSHPTDGLDHLAAHRERLKSVSKNEGLLLEMEFSGSELDDLRSWDYDNPDVMELKMEHLTTRSYEQFIEIFRFLDLLDEESSYLASRRLGVFFGAMRNRLAKRSSALSGLTRQTKATPELLLGRVFDHRFEKTSGGRKKGIEDPKSHYRKGVAGDWKNHFTPEHCRAFLKRFDGLLQVTGYEEDDSWVDDQVADSVQLGIG
ncbi:MAG: sulfotransferase domain-containing protein [Rhodothermales bacterium]